MTKIIYEHIREIIVCLISVTMLIVIHCGPPRFPDEVFYFSTFKSYSRAIWIVLIFLLVFSVFPQLRKARAMILFLQLFIMGYLGAEIFYRFYHPKLSIAFPTFPHLISLHHLDYFFIHRLYQIIPVCILIFAFFTYDDFTNYFHFGNWKVNTDFTRRKDDTWKRICIFFLAVLSSTFVLFVIHTTITPPSEGKVRIYWVPNWWTIIIPILLYAATSSLLEESLFRGILPVFLKYLGERGNLYQALLFGGIHFDITKPKISLVKLIIFSFLGWIWGKATKETGGIGCSYLMHFAIILILELRVNFFKHPAFSHKKIQDSYFS